jgi:hypothetical protein
MICKRCIIPASFPNITFRNGLCSFCINSERSAFNRTVKGHNQLVKILESKKGEGYDCIVPTGGGKDSSYVLYYVVRELGLKPLAFFFDNGFILDFAKQNLQNICKRLSVDLAVAKSRDFRRKAVIEALNVSNYVNQFWTTGICANCTNNALTAAMNEATCRKIPFIIWGHSRFENPSSDFGYESEVAKYGDRNLERFMNYILSYTNLIYCRNSTDYINALAHRWSHEYYVIRDNVATNLSEDWRKSFPFWEASFINKKVQSIGFFDYIAYDPFKSIEILKKEVGWRAPENRETRNDCRLHCLGNYANLGLTGITRDGFYLANLVREGLLTRNEAIEREEATKKDLERECQETLRAMGFGSDIMDKILHAQEFVVSRRRLLLRLKRELGAMKRLLNI